MTKNQILKRLKELKAFSKSTRCYVCNQPIDKQKDIYVGKGIWRHKKCQAGRKYERKTSIRK